VHDLEAIIEVADHLRDHQDILFAFVGDGAQLPDLQQSIQSRNLTNVRFFPPQLRSQLSTTLAVGDVHFVTMRAGCEGLVFPSKLIGICAIGRPVIVIGPRNSNLVTQVERHGLGHGFVAGDIPAIAETILQLKSDPNTVLKISQRSRNYAVAQDLAHATTQWLQLLHPEHTLAAEKEIAHTEP
jgi:glycosyltransferase involved in cell wall biosynthesis